MRISKFRNSGIHVTCECQPDVLQLVALTVIAIPIPKDVLQLVALTVISIPIPKVRVEKFRNRY